MNWPEEKEARSSSPDKILFYIFNDHPLLLRYSDGHWFPLTHLLMKAQLLLSLLFILAGPQFGSPSFADDELQPYFLVTTSPKPMNEVTADVKEALTAKGFEVIGEYNPEGKKDMHVIAYTRNDIQTLTLGVKDRGFLASVFKVGLRQTDGKVTVSMLNPMYIFYAYLRDEADKHIDGLMKFSEDARQAMKTLGGELAGFGGSEEIDDLKEYHYMAFMPYFDDAVELNTFSSFREGVAKIRANLKAGKGKTIMVYELIREENQLAMFGVGLLDEEKGEQRFLPVIGEDHLAAMPYEIILTGTEASMLHGKFRFALHWPELSMGQFMKISSTPGDVEDMLKALTE